MKNIYLLLHVVTWDEGTKNPTTGESIGSKDKVLPSWVTVKVKKAYKERVQLQLVQMLQRWWKSYNVQRYVLDNGLEMKSIWDATGVWSLKKKEKSKLI